MSAVTVELDAEQIQRLERVCRTTGADASVVIADALTIYETSLEDDYRQHFTPDQIAAIEAGLDDVKHGRLIDNDVFFERLRVKYGG
jgi:predicted transcriptional regulator